MKRTTKTQLLTMLVPGLGFIIVILATNILMDVSMHVILRDLATTAKVNPLIGFASNVGVLMWCATAAICLFAATFFWEDRHSEAFKFLLSAGLLSTWLTLDELFQIHDYLLKDYERVLLAALALSTAAFLLRFRRLIRESSFFMLALALGFFVISLTVDEIPGVSRAFGNDGVRIFAEDGAKWLGITCWFTYFLFTCRQLLEARAAR